jgi:hypothetical protein
MKRLEDDHAEKTVAAAHWQKVALQGLTEVDDLRSELVGRPLCSVAGHRALGDELEAKDLQLQMQATLVADWQKKYATAPRNLNVETRAGGVKGV